MPNKTSLRLLLFPLFIFFIAGYKPVSKTTAENATSYMVDKRDGKRYKVKKINGLWWTMENAAFVVEGSACYNGPDTLCKKDSRIYTWELAKMACPEGWRLPTHKELTALFAPYGKISYAGDEPELEKTFGAYEPQKTAATYKKLMLKNPLNLPVFDKNPRDYGSEYQQRTLFWTSDGTGTAAYAIYWDSEGNEGKGAVHFSDYPKHYYGFCRYVKK